MFNIYAYKSKEAPFTKWKNYILKKEYDILLEQMNSSQIVNRNTKSKQQNNSKQYGLTSSQSAKNGNGVINVHNIQSNLNNLFSQSKYNYQQSNSLKDSFLNRQERHIQKMKENKIKHENKKEEELRQLYTFSPKLNNNLTSSQQHSSSHTNIFIPNYYSNNLNISNNNKSVNSSSHLNNRSPNLSPKGNKQTAFDRLYRNNYMKEQQHSKHNTIYNNTKSNKSFGDAKHRPKTASSRHEQLYKDYKDLENKRMKLQKEIDNERGMTFKPTSYTANSGYVIQSNFSERNKKLLEDRQHFVFVYNYLRQRKFDENVLGHNRNGMLKDYMIQKGKDFEDLVQRQHNANQMMLAGKMSNGEYWNNDNVYTYNKKDDDYIKNNDNQFYNDAQFEEFNYMNNDNNFEEDNGYEQEMLVNEDLQSQEE
jgi:hypothetical protein